jgi:hypothetical protein
LTTLQRLLFFDGIFIWGVDCPDPIRHGSLCNCRGDELVLAWLEKLDNPVTVWKNLVPEMSSEPNPRH